MRLSFVSEQGVDCDALNDGFNHVASDLNMEYAIHNLSQKTKIAIMVSPFGHCLNDLLFRFRIGALPVEIVAVIPIIWTIRSRS